jgi:hypothetical protein
MLPYVSDSDLRLLYEDRIRDAQRPVPEWIGIATPRRSQRLGDGVRSHVRSSVARALRRLAASLDPRASTANA